ncbi:MAG: RNA polymerase factor sigma-54 [Clostridia bacterium]|nr:RNA polymerase factor sigma-54 [Clostridia bacterium]
MKLGFGLSLEQTQKLIMTPELRQAITVLQLSALELADYVEQELLENPLLEIKEDIHERDEKQDLQESKEEQVEGEKFDIDWQEYFNDRDLGYAGKGLGEVNEEFSYDNFLTKAPTLPDYLLFQLSLLVENDLERDIGEFIIGNLDEYGYLRTDLEEIANYFQLPLKQIERTLHRIQTLDPSGVGARNLKECLLIQLEQQNKKTPILERLILHHLEDLAAGKLAKLANLFGVPPIELQQQADIIKTLDPKPGRKFSNADDVRYITPDVVVERVEGHYVVMVNDTITPRLEISNAYKAMLGKDADHGAKEFVETKLNAAVWLIKSIEQRRLTLYKVADSIVRLQRDFLDYGVKQLKPMTLKRIADMIGMHESTVSRATSNKYIQTPQGVFELKFFFTRGLESTSEGGTTSSECIKRMLLEMVQVEDPVNPYSDQKFSDKLKIKGIKISRRTVAKYRDELNIPNAAQRRRY